MTGGELRIAWAGDAALVAEFEPRLDVDINRRAVSLAARLRAASPAGIRDIVVSAHAVTVYLDPLVADAAVIEGLLCAPLELARESRVAQEPIVVPVRYGGQDGPDLDDVARTVGVSPRAVIELHAGTTYRVFMMGFVPGFAYCGPLDERLRVPRLASPRLVVPARSVAIAGMQTAIYPMETPGGWRLIGRTDVEPFDPSRAQPFLFEVGSLVRFGPV